MATPRAARRWPFLGLDVDDVFLVDDPADFNSVKVSRVQYMRRYPGLVWYTQIKRGKGGRRYMQVKRVR